ncbi:hypothetical protein JHK85_025090 [Glycine max]|nr:hypothetical protein JHK85_025090 [Glycine max]
MKAPKGVSETDKNSCVIHIKCSSHKKIYKSSEDERICRICHLTSEQSSNATTVGTSDSAASANLIQLGCPRKDKLGIAHVHCVEVWFKLKGNIIGTFGVVFYVKFIKSFGGEDKELQKQEMRVLSLICSATGGGGTEWTGGGGILGCGGRVTRGG